MFACSKNFILNALFLLCITKACHGEVLLCYVCENCTEVTNDTPTFECNEDFFSSTTATSVMTTTDNWTSDTLDDSTMSTDSTTEITTDDTSTDSSTSPTSPTPATRPTPPTPPTVSGGNTPENVGTIPTMPSMIKLNDTAETSTPNSSNISNMQTSPKLVVPESAFRLRSKRSTINDAVTYHCYTLKKNHNKTIITERGCSRIAFAQGVCSELAKQNDNIEKCTPCSKTKCNSSASLKVSMTAVLLGLVALFLRSDV